jgi:hypothetical protein
MRPAKRYVPARRPLGAAAVPVLAPAAVAAPPARVPPLTPREAAGISKRLVALQATEPDAVLAEMFVEPGDDSDDPTAAILTSLSDDLEMLRAATTAELAMPYLAMERALFRLSRMAQVAEELHRRQVKAYEAEIAIPSWRPMTRAQFLAIAKGQGLEPVILEAMAVVPEPTEVPCAEHWHAMYRRLCSEKRRIAALSARPRARGAA